MGVGKIKSEGGLITREEKERAAHPELNVSAKENDRKRVGVHRANLISKVGHT